MIVIAHDDLEQLIARTRGRSLRLADPHDCRSWLVRCVEQLARAQSPDLDRLAAALQAIARADEPPKFEALLGIPSAWGGSDAERRDQLLRRAAAEFDAERGRSVALHQAWERFVARIYPLWRDDTEPPEGASRLHSLLFFATKLNRGTALSLRQVRNVIRDESAAETARDCR